MIRMSPATKLARAEGRKFLKTVTGLDAERGGRRDDPMLSVLALREGCRWAEFKDGVWSDPVFPLDGSSICVQIELRLAVAVFGEPGPII